MVKAGERLDLRFYFFQEFPCDIITRSLVYTPAFAANKQHSYRRLQPKGLRKRHDYETARVELAVAEIVRKEKPAKKKAEKPKAAEPKEAKQ